MLFILSMCLNLLLSKLDPGFLRPDSISNKESSSLVDDLYQRLDDQSKFKNKYLKEPTEKLFARINDDDFIQLLRNYEPITLCFECKILRTPRCRHCFLCNHCIDVYDHHCPWINNCVGKKNYKVFFAFILVQTLYVGLVSYMCLEQSFHTQYITCETTASN